MNSHADHSLSVYPPHPTAIRACRVSERKSGDVSIIEVDGSLTAEHAAQDFRNHVRELLDHGARKIAVGLGGVGEIDSYGLGELAAAYNWAAEAGGTIELFAPQPRVSRMLKRLCLDSVFAIFDDEADALRALCSARPPDSAAKGAVSWRWM